MFIEGLLKEEVDMKTGEFFIPDEIYLLCMLHNIGATSPERALTIEEIANWTALEQLRIERDLKILVDKNYVALNVDQLGRERYFITADGIRKVMSMYS
ncbi:hypothetical protein J7L29_08225 [Candidatus Bathyarchaeota archaeon]|nr:hypothetical protein [Candidatus Bathyarchaeota archaeon]